ncbi:MAG: NAD(P)/FAD-dependent oxidoreductase [Firmicutes bacterium]|nr:NAD(P)/FAD-dependent oxidoreductase [Bacillota bacterium]
MKKAIAVIGGGAAGMIAAGRGAELGAEVHLFERNGILGKKLLISGKGRCNLTNNSDIEEIISNLPGNGSFLYSSLYKFSNKDLINFFNSLGLKTKVERGQRVFPKTDKSSHVVKALEAYMRKNGVNVHLGQRVKDILINRGKVSGIRLFSGQILTFTKVILATGGLSYPQTGSSGDGYHIAEKLGHTIIPLKPSLVPLCTEEDWVKRLQGLTLKNTLVSAYYKNKKISEEFGELLFTHFGVSGPVILTMSREIVKYLSKGKVNLKINLKPALTWEQLDNRLQRDFAKYSRKLFKNGLNDLLPSKLIPVIIQLSNIPSEKPINQITKEERRALLETLMNLPLTIIKHRPIEEAIVTMGGISTKEIDPNTLESKIIKGLYFAGEIIDIDGFTGGYNLQAAFSTGYAAGTASASEIVNE